MRDSTSETHTHAHKEDQKQAVDRKQAVNCGTATHATRDGIATRRPMRGKAHAGKKNHTRTHRCNTCAHAYMRTFVRAYVRAYVRTHKRTYACMHMSTHMMFSHLSLPTQRSLRVAAIPSRVAVPWFAACTYARGMYPCAHVRMYAHMSTRMMFSQREPSHA